MVTSTHYLRSVSHIFIIAVGYLQAVSKDPRINDL